MEVLSCRKKVDIRPATVKRSIVEPPPLGGGLLPGHTHREVQLGSLENRIEFYTNYIRKQLNWTFAAIVQTPIGIFIEPQQAKGVQKIYQHLIKKGKSLGKAKKETCFDFVQKQVSFFRCKPRRIYAISWCR